jgi:hypothetical protein
MSVRHAQTGRVTEKLKSPQIPFKFGGQDSRRAAYYQQLGHKAGNKARDMPFLRKGACQEIGAKDMVDFTPSFPPVKGNCGLSQPQLIERRM